MKKISICIGMIMLYLFVMPFNVHAGKKGKNVFDALVYSKWLTEKKVNFENLAYAGTYPVFIFWSQCSG